MKINTLKEKREKAVVDLEKEALELKGQYVKVLTQIMSGKEKNLKKANLIKRDIAQLKSIISEKQKGETK